MRSGDVVARGHAERAAINTPIQVFALGLRLPPPYRCLLWGFGVGGLGLGVSGLQVVKEGLKAKTRLAFQLTAADVVTMRMISFIPPSFPLFLCRVGRQML